MKLENWHFMFTINFWLLFSLPPQKPLGSPHPFWLTWRKMSRYIWGPAPCPCFLGSSSRCHRRLNPVCCQRWPVQTAGPLFFLLFIRSNSPFAQRFFRLLNRKRGGFHGRLGSSLRLKSEIFLVQLYPIFKSKFFRRHLTVIPTSQIQDLRLIHTPQWIYYDRLFPWYMIFRRMRHPTKLPSRCLFSG